VTTPTNPGEATPTGKRPNGAGSTVKVTAAEKRRQAVELRKAGATFEEIAAAHGADGRRLYSNKGTAYRAVEQALREAVREPTRELIELETQRLDLMLRALWPQVIAGKLGAVDRALRVAERRARLLGLDGPQVVQHSGPDGGPIPVDVSGMTPEEKAARLAELIAEAQRRLTAEQKAAAPAASPDTPPSGAGE